MNLSELMKRNREAELTAVCRFIEAAEFQEIATVLEEIRCCHDNLFVSNPDTGLLVKIESVCINGEDIQLNMEPEEIGEEDMEIEGDL